MDKTTFMGYKRPYGRVGIRNHVVVMPGVNCAEIAARRIAESCKGSTLLTNPYGCVQSQGDTQITLKILAGLLANPNVHSVLIVGLGCETMQKDMYLEAVEERSPRKRVKYISIQQCGGIGRTVARGISIVQELMAEAEKCKREPCPIGELMLGLECGGSDPTSGICANVALGIVSDRLVDMGGSSVISETSEAIGAEHILKARGATPEIGQKIYDTIKWKDDAYREMGEDIRNSNPTPGNIRSGLTTLEEKSLGCINKSGTRPFTGCYAYGEMITTRGPAFLETGAYDPLSTIGELASGCQTVAFTTGMGNPMGCAVGPVIKITGNHQTYEWMNDLLDFDCSASLRGEKSHAQVADELFDLIIDVCEGKLTKAEINGSDINTIDHYNMLC